jgi:allophanate hydrolase subunit 1
MRTQEAIDFHNKCRAEELKRYLEETKAIGVQDVGYINNRLVVYFDMQIASEVIDLPVPEFFDNEEVLIELV